MSTSLRTLIVDPSAAFKDGVIRWAADRPEVSIVGAVRSGSEALAAVERLDPDLVLIDAVLPTLDGFRVVRLLKARRRAPLVVIVTFAASSAMQSRALEAGADGFVPKDDFVSSFELLLGELIDPAEPSNDAVKRRERSTPPGSRIERDP